MSLETVVTEVESEVKKVETAVVADAEKVVTEAKTVAYDVVAEVKKLRAEFDALLIRIANHNQSGGAI